MLLAKGSYQKNIGISSLFGVSQSTVSRTFNQIVQLIVTHVLPNEIRFPSTAAQFQSQINGFTQRYSGLMPNVFGAVDGTLIAIRTPPIHSQQYPARLYRTRKGYTGINVIVISTADSSFCYVNARFPGSVHDSAIFRTSLARIQLLEEFQATGRNNGILLGDQGFAVEPWLFPPLPGNRLAHEEQQFNRAHKQVRMGVENAIGEMKSVFRCLLKDRVLHYTPTFVGKIVYACATLHNFRIRHRVLNANDYDSDSDAGSVESAANLSDSEDDIVPDGVADIVQDRPRQQPGELFTLEGNQARYRYIRNNFRNQ